MTEKLPKAITHALAQGAAPAEHPAADLLAAFAERTLREDEWQKVAEHLAVCGDCRGIVFLASGAGETPEQEEESPVADHRSPANRPADEAAMATARLVETPVSLWKRPVVWAVSIAAVAVVAAGVGVYQVVTKDAERKEIASALPPQAKRQAPAEAEHATTASAPAEVAAPEASAQKPAAKTNERISALAGKVAPRASAVEPAAITAREAASPRPAASSAELAMKREEAKAAPDAGGASVVVGGAIPAAPAVAPRANGFVQPSGAEAQSFSAASGPLTAERATLSVMQTLHPGWRVTVDGHLERRTPQGWSRVLAEQTRPFRTVAVLGSDVWAGGDEGMLYHSSVGGQAWKRVALGGAGSEETAAVVTIRFEDAEHGTVTTSTGTTYATRDGGVSWTKQ